MRNILSINFLLLSFESFHTLIKIFSFFRLRNSTKYYGNDLQFTYLIIGEFEYFFVIHGQKVTSCFKVE